MTRFYKKIALTLSGALLCTSLCSCNATTDTNSTTEAVTTLAPTLEATEETPTAEATKKPEESTAEPTTKEEEPTTQEEEPTTQEAGQASISDSIPIIYTTQIRKETYGTIQKISYTTKDYAGDGAEITKDAYIYLPYDYTPEKTYNVLYLMHGIGGDEAEWGMTSSMSKVKLMMDNLIYYNEIDPFIIVTPNGRSAANHGSSSDYNSFYLFGQELRNDLIPFIEGTYANVEAMKDEAYDLTSYRDHRAMAGLSMGGMQTINIGLCECLDLISYFGTFSAAPTSYPSAAIAEKLQAFPEEYDIKYMYNICGLQDGTAYASSSTAAKYLTQYTDRLTNGENFMWYEKNGGHDFNIWYLGFFHFAQLAFK